MMFAGRSIHGSRHRAAVSDKPQRRLRALRFSSPYDSPSNPLTLLHPAWFTWRTMTNPPWAHLVGEVKHLRTLWQPVRRSRVLPSVITTSTQSIKNMQFVFNSLPLDPKYFSIQEKTFQRHFSRVNANIVTTLAWIPSGRCMDLYLCKGRVGELATHKRYWFRNCLP